jgi:hypothetical protein
MRSWLANPENPGQMRPALSQPILEWGTDAQRRMFGRQQGILIKA